MGFGYVATFLDDFNSPGNGRAHLDEVEESEGSTRPHRVCVQQSSTGELAVKRKRKKKSLWSKILRPSIIHCSNVYVRVVSDCSVSSLVGSRAAIQETHSVNTGLRRSSLALPVSCRTSMSTHRDTG